MSYTQNPDTLTAAYRPIVFRSARNSAEDVESLLVTVYVYGGQEAQFRKDYTQKSGSAYTFDIDVQAIISRFLKPNTTTKSSLFASTTAFEQTGNTDNWCDYYIESKIEYRNASGFLTTSAASTETSSTLYAIAATRQQSETIALTGYHYMSSAAYFDFLTLAPSAVSVGREEAFHLSYIGYDLDTAEYNFYQGSSATDTVQVALAGIDNTEYNLATLTTGPANIEGGGYSFTYRAGSDTMPTALSSYDYYTISLGSFSGTYTRKSIVRRYNLENTCAHARRFYWMNPLGGIDQYTFEGLIIKKVQHTGAVTELSMPWNPGTSPPTNPYNRGLTKTDIAGQVILDITERVPLDVAAWLRGLLTSPEVYLENNGDYLAVAINPGGIDIDNSARADVAFKFTAVIERTFTQEI